MNSKELKTDLLLGLFVMALILANTLGVKIVDIFGIRFSAGIFFIPIMFLITDVINEVYGKKKATEFVYISLFVMVITLIAMYFAINLPAHPTWPNQEAYATIFGSSLRMTLASIIAFFVSQFHDVWAFDYWKKKTKGKYLWLRNNASTFVSQFIDSVLFMFIAFYKVAPKFDFMFVISLIIPLVLLKIILALIDTPFCYALVSWLKKD